MDYDKQKKQWAKRRVQIRKMRSDGIPVMEIAARLRISRQRVYQLMGS